jgi:hypothetical protein
MTLLHDDVGELPGLCAITLGAASLVITPDFQPADLELARCSERSRKIRKMA